MGDLGGYAFLGFQAQRQRADQEGFSVRQLFLTDRLLPDALDLVQDRLCRSLDVFGSHPGDSRPGTWLEAGIQAGVAIVGQSLFVSHIVSDTSHHAKLSQDTVGNIGRKIVRMVAPESYPAHDDVTLRFARDCGVHLADLFQGNNLGQWRLDVFCALPRPQRTL